MTDNAKAIFLSYASQDAEAAHRICKALRAAGIEVWFDQSELRGGDVWDRKIRQHIRDCALFIPVISSNTASRHEGYFRLEWDLADHRTHMMARDRAFIVPVVVDQTAERAGDVPDSFQRVQWTRLQGGRTSEELVDRIARLLERDEGTADDESTRRDVASQPRIGPASTGRKPRSFVLWSLAAFALFAVGYFVADHFRSAPRSASSPAPIVTGAGETLERPVSKSIAVLPFADMSEKHDQEYFSDGLAEELLDLLAKTQGLRVIARTSSFYFKGKQVPLAEIASTLNVGNILEGSVRKSGNRLRVTTQLIRADTGEHLWSETYDRDLKDLFQVQDDIAGAVVKALRDTLLASSGIGDRTANLDAYALLQQAKLLIDRQSGADLRQAVALLQRAVSLDPTYAAAWVQLSRANLLLAYWVDAGREEWDRDVDEARSSAAKALALDPQRAAAHVALADIKAVVDWDQDGAAREIEAAHRAEPEFNVTAARVSSFLAGCTAGACYEGQIHDMNLAIDRDPLNALAFRRRAWMHFLGNQLPEAEADARRALELSPGMAVGRWVLVRILVTRHEFTNVLSIADGGPELERQRNLALAYWVLGRRAEADAALQALAQRPEYWGDEATAAVYAVRGDYPSALNWLERSVNARYGRGRTIEAIPADPLFAPLRGDPRFVAILKKTGYAR